MLPNIRSVTQIITGKDEKAKAIREILDLFLPKFKNLSKETPILIDLPKNLSASVVGTGVSVLTDLYYEIEINPKIYNNDKEYVIKGAIRNFEYFLRLSPNATKQQLKRISKYKLELEKVNKFTDITPELFMACIVLNIYIRCGIADFDLFKKSNIYYNHCMEIVELLLKNININNSVIANPIFGCIEHMISGDGDFILDGNLFDIKTTKSITVDKNSRRQLLFYYLMNYNKSLFETYEKRYDISKLYIYKARYGISIEIPINLRGANPLDVINTITKVETEKVSPSRGIEIVKSILQEELEPKKEGLKPKTELKLRKRKKAYKFKLKKVFVCNETNEIFNRVIDANEKYGFSKNTIYRCLEGSRKYSISKYGTKLTWRVMYCII